MLQQCDVSCLCYCLGQSIAPKIAVKMTAELAQLIVSHSIEHADRSHGKDKRALAECNSGNDDRPQGDGPVQVGLTLREQLDGCIWLSWKVSEGAHQSHWT